MSLSFSVIPNANDCPASRCGCVHAMNFSNPSSVGGGGEIRRVTSGEPNAASSAGASDGTQLAQRNRRSLEHRKTGAPVAGCRSRHRLGRSGNCRRKLLEARCDGHYRAPSSAVDVPQTMLSQIQLGAPHDVVVASDRAPDDVVIVVGGAADDAAAPGRAPDDVVLAVPRAPDDVVVIVVGAPDDVVVVHRAPDDVVVVQVPQMMLLAVGVLADDAMSPRRVRAPDDVVVVWTCPRRCSRFFTITGCPRRCC